MRIRMCDADRERYGGPEWVELTLTELLDEQAGLIERIEDDWGMTPAEFLAACARASIRGLRAMIWAGRLKAGCTDDPRTFKPSTQPWAGVLIEWDEAETAAPAADADPPANRAERRTAARKRTAKSATSSTSTA